MTETRQPKYVTVVYEVIDMVEWEKTNPLHYQHHGLKAIGVSVGDLQEKIERMEDSMYALIESQE